MPELTLDESTHIYTLDGRRLPSVTQILNEWLKVSISGYDWYVNTLTGAVVPALHFEKAGDRGRAVHKIFQYCLTGQGVDRDSLDPSLIMYLNGIEKWIEHYDPEVILCETPLYDKELLYAGTLDIFFKTKKHKNAILADLKTGDPGQVGMQTAAYERLVRKETGYRGIIDRWCIHLPSGSYTFHKIGAATDFQYFLLKLKIYQIEGRNQ